MRLRTTLILLAILVGLGAFVLLYERQRPAPAEPGSTPEPTAVGAVFSFAAEDVKGLRISRPASGETLEMAYRDTGLWHITTPVASEADQDSVTYFVETLATLQPNRLLEGAGAPSDYGLDPPDLLIEIEMVGGARYLLKIGAATPAGSGYYGQVGDDSRVYVLGYYFQYDAADLLDNPPLAPTATPTEAPTTPEPETTPTS
jgi:hypothetical protein